MPFRVLCQGEAIVDMVSVDRGVALRDASGFRRAPGGAPANVAVALSRLGTRAAFMGCVGDDEFGACMRETLERDGVDISLLVMTQKARTTLAFVSVREDGERSFAFYRNPGADHMFEPGDLPPGRLDEVDVFHFGSLSMSAEPSREATLVAAALARRQGRLVSFDPNLRLPLWRLASDARESILEGMRLADIVKISEEEGKFLFGAEGTPESWAERIAGENNTRIVLVSLGADGAIVRMDEEIVRAAGFKVEVADTTGAGDGFVAGFLHALGAGIGAADPIEGFKSVRVADLERPLNYACAVGALACTKTGAIPALPTAAAVEALLGERIKYG